MSKYVFPALRIEQAEISSLVPDPKNARVHTDRQIRQLAKSISVFGFLIPIVAAARTRKIACGVGRFLAARHLGMTVVPVVFLEHLSEAQLRAFAIADNRLAEIATWNDQLLGETLKDLSALDLNFSLEVTGFSMGEIDLRIEGLPALGKSGPDPADKLPDISHVAPVSKVGDVWQLRDHRLLCNDALDHHSYVTLMRCKLADVVVADVPYNVPIRGHVSGKGRIQHREFAMASGEMTTDQYSGFLDRVSQLLHRHCAPAALLYIFIDWRHCGEVLQAGKTNFHELKNICVWVKDNGGMGSLYRSAHEFVLVFKNGAAAHRNNVELGRHGRYRTNVWNYPGVNSFSRKSDEGNLLALHPTVKPVALIADALLDCSARGDLVLDPFLGSGSTVIAAQRVGRVCYGIEIDPLYVDCAIRRWQRFTGDFAVHSVTGKRFDDVEREAVNG